MTRVLLILGLMSVLSACVETPPNNFTPREKTATYDPVSEQLTLPHPCPDWSQTQTENYRNEAHSNYGCAVNTNNALQIANPKDVLQGRGAPGPDSEVTARTVERYRAGEIPAELTPVQGSGSSQ